MSRLTSFAAALLCISSISSVSAQTVIPDSVVIEGYLELDGGNLGVATQLSPSLILEQLGDEANPYAIWQLTGDEESMRFRQNGANRFCVTPNSRIGLNTPSPLAAFHATCHSESGAAEQLALFQVTDDTVGRLSLNNNSTTNGILHPRIQGVANSQATPLSLEGLITLDAGSNPCVSFNAARASGGAVNTRPLVAFRNNIAIKAVIAANGEMTATSFNPTSSRDLKRDISPLDPATTMAAFERLQPVSYVFKDDETAERRLGFIAEDVPEIVSSADRKSVPIMDVVALTTQVLKGQQQLIEQQREELRLQREELQRQREMIERLSERLEQMVRDE